MNVIVDKLLQYSGCRWAPALCQIFGSIVSILYSIPIQLNISILTEFIEWLEGIMYRVLLLNIVAQRS